MLQQIIKDMYIEPELLEELSEDQKQILYFKMREEQIRRYKVRMEEEETEEKLNSKPKKEMKVGLKNVSFLTDDKDGLIVHIIKEQDGENVVDADVVKKRVEAAALKRATLQAKQELEEQRQKELKAMEEKRKEEEQRLKNKEEKLRKEREQKEAELKKQAERAAVLEAKEADLQREKADLERIEMERRRVEEEKQREQALNQLREKEETENKKRDEERQIEEEKRKNEIYEKLKVQQEEEQQKEEKEAMQLQHEWEERETKAKAAEKQRRSSISQARSELSRQRRLAKEREELEKSRLNATASAEEEKVATVAEPLPSLASDANTSKNVFLQQQTPLVLEEKEKEKSKKEKGSKTSFSFGRKKKPSLEEKGIKKKNSSPTLLSAAKTKSPERPALPTRPSISAPQAATGTRTEHDTIPVKKEIFKPTRPPPAPKKISGGERDTAQGHTAKSPSKPPLPPRPKNHSEVVKWWRDNEFDKGSGLDDKQKPLQWFHGIITRLQAEHILEEKSQGSFLIRVSERVWGYTISYKDLARFKHFLIDSSSGYQLFGTEQKVHVSLNELVNYHTKNPISGLGQEILRYPVGQEKDVPDYAELLVENTSI